MTEEIELNGTQKTIALLLIGFVIGILTTYAVLYDNSTPDEIVTHFEKSLMDVTKVRSSLVNELSTVGQLQEFYFRYRPISTYLLKMELSDICGGRWMVDGIPEENLTERLDDFCLEVCP